ncbi:uncharacterized protein [Chelonus insularis]|uniref:uncharacterized protein n=1 Tax=Chelonus insularis TaxID=460826 RepID=UPI001588B32D|nr:uncharacterized protein LOC118068487 [Chelonus insularis]
MISTTMDCNVNLTHMDRSHLNCTTDEGKSSNNFKTMISSVDGVAWIAKFKSMCLTNMDNSSTLINLMTYFIRNVRPTVAECQTKPLRADKLKGFIGETLLFFMYYYKSHEGSHDRTIYMDLMSDLLAMYIDLELKASKKSCEYHERISGRLASYLYVYLENSAEYLMDTILKIRFMSSTYYQIINPLLTKIFRVVPEHPTSNLMYVRYFLVYRIWKRITKDSNSKNDVNSRALSSLASYPTSLPQYVTDHVLPKVPNNQKVSTRLLLTQHIELEKSCEAFIKFCKKSRIFKDPEEVEQTRSDDTIELLELEDNLSCKLNVSSRENTAKKVLLNNNSCNNQTKDSINSSNFKLNSDKSVNSKFIPRKVQKNNGDIVLIDLTSEDSSGKISKQKKSKKLSWIQKIFKRPSNTPDITEDNKNINQNSQLEDTFNLESLLITSNKDKIVDDQMEIQSSLLNVDEITQGNLTENEIIEEESRLILTETCMQVLETSEEYKENIESHSCKNGQVSKVEYEESSENVEQKIKVQKFPVVNDKAKVTPLELNFCKEKNVNRTNVSESEDLVDVNSSKVMEKINSNINSQAVLNTIKTNVDANSFSQNIEKNLNQQPEAMESFKKNNLSKIHDVDFNDHIDGLSLLASVSQRVSHLNTEAPETNQTKEFIKVKDYNSLMTYNEMTEDQRNEDFNNQSAEDANRFIDVYPDGIDRVALNVEVSSSEDLSNHCLNSVQEQQNNSCMLNELPIELTSTSVQVESSISSDKDETNVILNGETIVLLQKSPNSNLYIINKAVENRDHSNEEEAMNLSEKNLMLEKVKDESFSREIHDPVYRISQSFPPTTQYELAQESRKVNKIKIDPTAENITCLDSKKPTKNNSDANNSGRCRIKQEFSDCTNNLSNHMGNPAYVNQVRPKDLVDPHGLHISASNSRSGIYHPTYSTGDLYISCRKNYSSVACGLPVNHPGPPLHSRAKSQQCSCFNCAYGIITHCNQYIIPPNETKATSKIDGGFYIPISDKPVIPECPLQTTHQSNELGMYENKLLCKIEANLDDRIQEKIYQKDVNYKLPLKKRFKSMTPIDYVTPIKKENVVNNFIGSPMISIAALEGRESIDSSSTLMTNIHSSSMIRGEYEKDVISNYDNFSDRKRKKVDGIYSTDDSTSLKRINEEMVRSSKKVKQPKSPKKNPTKKTRSSQRKIPKINYSYMDDETECTPSSEIKLRKKKKTSR